jgi:hypothetical protein
MTMVEPTEGITPWRASQHCCCGKSECKEIKDFIDQDAPKDHVWRGDYIVVNISDSVKAVALHASIVHHLKAPADLKKYRVARHHWSQAVLSSAHKRRTNLVTLEDVKAFDNTDGGHNRHQDPVNKVENIFRRLNRPVPDFEMKRGTHNMYVQAPVQDRNAAREVALGFTSTRKSRAEARGLSFGEGLPVAGGVPDSPLVEVPESPNVASMHAADEVSSPFATSPVGSPTIVPSLKSCISYLQSKFARVKQDTDVFMAHVEVGKALRLIASVYSTREIILADEEDVKLVACCVCNVEGSALHVGESLGYAVRTRTSDSATCSLKCTMSRHASLQKLRRKRKCTSDPADANSKARKDQMSPRTLLRNTRNISRELAVVKTKLSRELNRT